VSPSLQARARLGTASFAWRRNDLDRARDLAEQACIRFRELDDLTHVAWSLASLSIIESLAGNLAKADALSDEAAQIFRELGHEWGELTQIHNQGLSAIAAGDYVRARPLLEQSLAEAERLGSDQHAGNALCDLGVLALHERHYEEAIPLFARSLESAVRTGWRINVVYTLRGLAAATAQVSGDLDAAARMLGAADAIEEEIGEDIQGYAASIFAETGARLFDQLDEPQIAAAYASGRAMSQPDAVAHALATVGERAPL
jgi:tetratricopeptide (TPR) repeat protein